MPQKAQQPQWLKYPCSQQSSRRRIILPRISHEPDSKRLKVATDTCDLILNRKLDRNNIPEVWLPDEHCAHFGVCGEEYDSILRELNQNGRTRR